ncbi:esterase-like activity of phytase family protein [Methylopila henanensis]|uniref:Esterase-like activity of phytase family protein n=1 Tax=Methylopila henanensis TaxID=873516 RepID=A0ABW4K6J7_9HYPH
MRRFLTAVAALFGIALAFPSEAARAQETAIDVAATRIDRFDIGTPAGARYGELVFLGGLRLTSTDPAFGGLSGLRLSEDGRRFTAISDRGNWFRGALVYDGRALAGVGDVTREPIRGPRGPLPGRRGSDTEALEIRGSSAWIASERVNEVLRFALEKDGRAGPGRRVALPEEARKAPFNEGFEAIATTQGGALLMVAEKFLDANGDNRAFVVGAKRPFAFSVRRTEDFSPTDLARLPGGGFVLLERRYVPPFSLTIRMRRLDEADMRPGAVVDGPVLMTASLIQTIDNFEGVSAHRDASGVTVITVVSDNNFSLLQRTLMLQFALPD